MPRSAGAIIRALSSSNGSMKAGRKPSTMPPNAGSSGGTKRRSPPSCASFPVSSFGGPEKIRIAATPATATPIALTNKLAPPTNHSVSLIFFAVPIASLATKPNVDGKPAIAQLVGINFSDVKLQGAWTGEARLELIPAVNCPLADLPVRRVSGGLHMVTDMTLPYGRVLHDYLA